MKHTIFNTDREPPMIFKGEWFTFCCWRDMEQAKEDIPGDDGINFMVFACLKDALEYELRPQGIGVADRDEERKDFIKWLNAGPCPHYEALRQAVLAECPEYQKPRPHL